MSARSMDSRLAPLLALRGPPWRTKGRPSIQITRMPSILGSSAQSSGGSCKSDAGPAAGAGGYQGRVKVGMEASTTWQRSPRSAAHRSGSVSARCGCELTVAFGVGLGRGQGLLDFKQRAEVLRPESLGEGEHHRVQTLGVLGHFLLDL